MIVIKLTIFFLIGLDRFLKIAALRSASLPRSLVDGILSFNFTKNYQLAFSIPLNGTITIIITAAIFLALVIYYNSLLRKKEYLKSGAVLLIAYGAASNLFDRLSYGFVIDYFDLKYFTVFNLADMMIVAGVIILIIMSANKKTIKV